MERSSKAGEIMDALNAFMDEHIYPNEALYEQQLAQGADRFNVPPIMEELKARAREAGLWNLFLPHSEYGAGLTNAEYAPLAEVMGRVQFASEVFNCSAPDTGNMEVLDRYGTPEQKARWLQPLLDGKIRSSFCMTEPEVASSDATNITTSIDRDGDHYVINGRKWWITNAYHPNTKIYIVMGKTNPDAPRHRQQSQILVEPDTPGISLIRPLTAFGFYDEPKGQAEIVFDNVRVPASNLILGEGRGFEISQGRLGPGRIHHCMRIIGQCERMLEQTCRRLLSRTAFGEVLADQSLWQDRIANARTDINMLRQLVEHTAHLMDTVGNKQARSEISQIKVAAVRVGRSVADLAVQAHGAAGLCNDFGLGYAFTRMNMIRMGDGPEEVHNRTIARLELKKYSDPGASSAK
ncbi:acyl-CoA dehydrogenase [Novosphingobium marinum]|uniref:Acyl-CoA dehydrogenase n=1 Tax=Novosphingobium marinum TaxID=1514948 RepID=A0A7Y9XYT1_9SPHN|nr:acyl-CoA dehydrogenase family protein [Novosphingobium marinum]NYH97104.1 acyl-CoA dehydrogenase [Novosphingobium marinum]GGC43732.1 acyl-CoA dehydrogenase [Novosphingobium marinum]